MMMMSLIGAVLVTVTGQLSSIDKAILQPDNILLCQNHQAMFGIYLLNVKSHDNTIIYDFTNLETQDKNNLDAHSESMNGFIVSFYEHTYK